MNENYLKLCKKYKVCGVSIASVDKNGKNFFQYGIRNESSEMIEKDTIFRIASISKTFVMICAMILVEQGKMKLDDDISTLLGYRVRNPFFEDDVITLEMLMTQTSSIADGYDDEDPKNDKQTRGYNNVNMMGTKTYISLKDLLTNKDYEYYTDLDFHKCRPGSEFHYSNFGCGILAMVVETVSNELFTVFAKKHIFDKLNLDASFRMPDIKRKDLVSGTFSINEEGISTIRCKSEFFTSGNPLIHPIGDNFRGPAGGVYISMEGLLKYMSIYLNNGTSEDGVKVVEKETMDEILRMHWYNDKGVTEGYNAKGLQLKISDTVDTNYIIGHTGSAYNIYSFMFFDVEKQKGMCFITNGLMYKIANNKVKGVFNVLFHDFMSEFFGKEENDYTIKINKKGIYLNDRYISNKLDIMSVASALRTIPFEGKLLSPKGKYIEYNDDVISMFNKMGLTFTLVNKEYLIKYRR